MSTQRDERDRHDSPGKARARAGRMRAAWALLLLLAAPFVAGAKGCDQAVVGNECPKGTAPAKSARCGGNAGNADAGQTVVDGGSAGAVTCGGLRGVSCPAGEYCNFPPGAMCGAADQTGTCAPKPEVCTEQYAPVCGCDGKTYGNACAAAGAGVSVVHTGACTTTTPPPNGNPAACGGLRGATCAKGQYCQFPAGSQCGAADQTGTCTDIPQACDLIYKPVCGCDGKTYGNDCDAASHGTSVASDGACPGPVADAGPTPSTCGGLLGTACPSSEYCDFPASAMCGAGDQTGTCTTKPQICNDLTMPVCGCDGKTYPNSCYAARSGVSVASQGSCATPPTGKTCGGLAGFQCAQGEYCSYDPSAHCGIADQPGTCATIPSACTKEYVPVCGCDGKTYGNACMAAAAGMGLSANMACPASCGSRGLPACPSGQYCNFPTSASCGAADAPGTCAAIPQVCTQEFAPVCGCDGKTYGNACEASAAGQSVASTGGCTNP